MWNALNNLLRGLTGQQPVTTTPAGPAAGAARLPVQPRHDEIDPDTLLAIQSIQRLDALEAGHVPTPHFPLQDDDGFNDEELNLAIEVSTHEAPTSGNSLFDDGIIDPQPFDKIVSLLQLLNIDASLIDALSEKFQEYQEECFIGFGNLQRGKNFDEFMEAYLTLPENIQALFVQSIHELMKEARRNPINTITAFSQIFSRNTDLELIGAKALSEMEAQTLTSSSSSSSSSMTTPVPPVAPMPSSSFSPSSSSSSSSTSSSNDAGSVDISSTLTPAQTQQLQALEIRIVRSIQFSPAKAKFATIRKELNLETNYEECKTFLARHDALKQQLELVTGKIELHTDANNELRKRGVDEISPAPISTPAPALPEQDDESPNKHRRFR